MNNQTVSSYPGWKEAQARGGFDIPDTVDVKGLMALAQKLIGGVFGRATKAPVKAQGNVVGDPSQMKITYGSTKPKTSSISEDQIRKGFSKFSANAPLATQSGVISQALSKLSPSIDPKLILALALKESRGGQDLVGRQQGQNNPYNVMYGGKLINYPDLQTALMGGENQLEGSPSKGLINILNSPLYQKYQQSGNLEDFFNTYSPEQSGNAPIKTQVQQAQELMRYFQ